MPATLRRQRPTSTATAEQGTQFADAAREGVNKMVDLREQATENTKQVVQKSVETASQQAREAADRFTRTLGFSGEDSERLARQSKQNMEAVTRCGTVLTQAFQDASRSWFGLAQRQFQRNLEGMNKLAACQVGSGVHRDPERAGPRGPAAHGSGQQGDHRDLNARRRGGQQDLLQRRSGSLRSIAARPGYRFSD